MAKRILFSQNTQTIIALILGVICGLLNNSLIDSSADLVAEIAIRLMKLIAVPLLFLSIICSASHFKNLQGLKDLGLKVAKYTFLTTFIAALVAQLIYWLASPYLLQGSLIPEVLEIEQPRLINALLNMIPDNFLKAFLENNVLGLVIIAVFSALAFLTLPEKEKDAVFCLFSGLLNALMKIVHVGLKFLPLAVWAFVALLTKQITAEDQSSFNAVGALIITVFAANLVQGLVVLPLLLKLKGHRPWLLAKQVREALALAFFTRSSTAALPVTLDHAINDAKISEDVARLSLPLCSTINMNGCAQFILLSVYFVSYFSGHPLVWWEQIGMIIISVVAAVGNAGVPMGCFYLASSILSSKNIPLHLMYSILPLYSFIDMVETSLNVWSDVTVAKIVDKEIAG